MSGALLQVPGYGFIARGDLTMEWMGSAVPDTMAILSSTQTNLEIEIGGSSLEIGQTYRVQVSGPTTNSF